MINTLNTHRVNAYSYSLRYDNLIISLFNLHTKWTDISQTWDTAVSTLQSHIKISHLALCCSTGLCFHLQTSQCIHLSPRGHPILSFRLDRFSKKKYKTLQQFKIVENFQSAHIWCITHTLFPLFCTVLLGDGDVWNSPHPPTQKKLGMVCKRNTPFPATSSTHRRLKRSEKKKALSASLTH